MIHLELPNEHEFPLSVEMDGNVLDISWDPDHPVTRVFNNWRPEDFRDWLIARCEKVIEEHGSKDWN